MQRSQHATPPPPAAAELARPGATRPQCPSAPRARWKVHATMAKARCGERTEAIDT